MALLAENMVVRHTGTGAEMIGALKNSTKTAGPLLGGLLIDYQSYCLDVLEYVNFACSLEPGVDT